MTITADRPLRHPASTGRTTVVDEASPTVIHPLHAVLLGGALALFLAGLLGDLAYASDYQVQWLNLAAWTIAGAMVFAGLALLWSFIDLFRASRRGGRARVYFLLLLASFALGLVNSFVHGYDAWGAMPNGLILSAVVVLLALLATLVGASRIGSPGAFGQRTVEAIDNGGDRTIGLRLGRTP